MVLAKSTAKYPSLGISCFVMDKMLVGPQEFGHLVLQDQLSLLEDQLMKMSL